MEPASDKSDERDRTLVYTPNSQVLWPKQLRQWSQTQDSGDDEAGPAYPPIPPKYAMLQEIIGKGGYKFVHGCADKNACCMVSIRKCEDKYLIVEANMMSELNHPNILPVIVAGSHGDRFVIIARRMEGDLHDKGRSMAQDGTLNNIVLLHWVQEIASGLEYMHEKEIVHRDIKPSNILIEGQHVKISDLGLSTRAPCTRDVGTPSFKAPEIVGLVGHRSPYGTPVDIFALALTIIYILTGKSPFHMHNTEMVNQRMRRALRTARRGDPGDPATDQIPPEFWIIKDTMWQPLLLQCLTVDPAARPSAKQLYQQCREALAPPTIHVHPHMKEELQRLGIEQEADLEEVDEDFLRDPECKLDLETKRRLMKMKAEWEARKTTLWKPIVHDPPQIPAAGGAAAGGAAAGGAAAGGV
jgi:serine/threonine protein kinase